MCCVYVQKGQRGQLQPLTSLEATPSYLHHSDSNCSQEMLRSSDDSLCATRLCPFHCSLEIQYPNQGGPQSTKDIKVWGGEGFEKNLFLLC